MCSKLKSISEKISLMESEIILESISDTFSSKLQKDVNRLKEKEQEIKKQLGDKYDEALKVGTEEAYRQLSKIKTGIKSLMENKSPNLLEKLSEYLFLTIGLVVGSVYKVLSGSKLSEETPKTFYVHGLFASVLITNTSIAMAMEGLLRRRYSRTSITILFSCFVAPLTEEYAKRAALNISDESGDLYTKYFASLEAIIYIVQFAPQAGIGTAFLMRIPPFIMHLFTTKLQKYITSINSQELRYISFLLAVVFHSVYNIVVIEMMKGPRS